MLCFFNVSGFELRVGIDQFLAFALKILDFRHDIFRWDLVYKDDDSSRVAGHGLFPCSGQVIGCEDRARYDFLGKVLPTCARIIRIVDLLHESVILLNVLAADSLACPIDKARKPRFKVKLLQVVFTRLVIMVDSKEELLESLDHHDCNTFTVEEVLECLLNSLLKMADTPLGQNAIGQEQDVILDTDLFLLLGLLSSDD